MMDKAEVVFEKLGVTLGLKHIIGGSLLGAGIVGGSFAYRSINNSKQNPKEANIITNKLKKQIDSKFGDADWNRNIGTYIVKLKNNPSQKNIQEAKEYLNFVEETKFNNR